MDFFYYILQSFFFIQFCIITIHNENNELIQIYLLIKRYSLILIETLFWETPFWKTRFSFFFVILGIISNS